MISLPDVNVLLALVAEGHTHHSAAKDWFLARDKDSVGVCRVTQMGFLRLLTNAKVLTAGPYSIRRAWEIWNEFSSDHRVFFEHEPPDLEPVWSVMINHAGAGPSSWTDAYLAAFAKGCNYEMVTFDLGFRRWNDLALTVLTSV